MAPTPPSSRTRATSPSATDRARVCPPLPFSGRVSYGWRLGSIGPPARIRQPEPVPFAARRRADLEAFEMTAIRVCHVATIVVRPALPAPDSTRADDRHLVKPCRDSGRQIAAGAIAFELECVQFTHPRAIGREEQSPDSRWSARVPLGHAFEGTIVGQTEAVARRQTASRIERGHALKRMRRARPVRRPARGAPAVPSRTRSAARVADSMSTVTTGFYRSCTARPRRSPGRVNVR